MVEISEELKKFLRRIPMNILSELSSITQEIEYKYNDDAIIWGSIEELTRQISYAYREGNNPEEVKILDLEDYKVLIDGFAYDNYVDNEDFEIIKKYNEIKSKNG